MNPPTKHMITAGIVTNVPTVGKKQKPKIIHAKPKIPYPWFLLLGSLLLTGAGVTSRLAPQSEQNFDEASLFFLQFGQCILSPHFVFIPPKKEGRSIHTLLEALVCLYKNAEEAPQLGRNP